MLPNALLDKLISPEDGRPLSNWETIENYNVCNEWLADSGNNLSLDELFGELCKSASLPVALVDDQDSLLLALLGTWIKKPENKMSYSTLKERLFPLCDGLSDAESKRKKINMITAWIKNANNCDEADKLLQPLVNAYITGQTDKVETTEILLGYGDDPAVKDRLMRAWLSVSSHDLPMEAFERFYQGMVSTVGYSYILVSWVLKDRKSMGIDRLVWLLEREKDEDLKHYIVQEWYKHTQDGILLDVDGLIKFLPHMHHLRTYTDELYYIEKWLDNKKYAVTAEEISRIIKECDVYKQTDINRSNKQVELAEKWLKFHPDATLTELNLLLEINKSLASKHLFWENRLIHTFVNQEKYKEDADERYRRLLGIVMLPSIQTMHSDVEWMYVRFFGAKLNLIKLHDYIEDVYGKDDTLRARFIHRLRDLGHLHYLSAEKWKELLADPRGDEFLNILLTRTELQDIDRFFAFINKMLPLINYRISYNQAIGILNICRSSDKFKIYAPIFMGTWIEHNQSKITIAEFRALFEKVDEIIGKDLIKKYVNRDVDKLISVLSSNSSMIRFDPVKTYNIFKHCEIQPVLFRKFLLELYPHREDMRVELFHAATTESIADHKTRLIEILNDIKDDETFYKLLTTYSYMLTSIELYDLFEGHISRHYESLSAWISLPLSDVLTAEGIEVVKRLFGDHIALTRTLGGFLMCYEMRHSGSSAIHVAQLIKPDVLGKMQREYVPSSKQVCTLRREHESLVMLGIDPLPVVEIISKVIESKITTVPPINKSKFELTRTALSGRMRESCEITKMQGNIAYRLLELLVNPDHTENDVYDFFKNALDADVPKQESSKLFEYFKKNQGAVAFIFSQPGGAQNFALILQTLTHGCVANIGTQAKWIQNKILLGGDVLSLALYNVFEKDIVASVIQRTPHDILGSSPSGFNPMAQREITEAAISPMGLVDALVAEFYNVNDKKVVTDAWGTIGAVLNEDDKFRLYEVLSQNTDTLDMHAARIAAYLVIRERVPEILTSKYISEFKEACEQILAGNPPNEASVSATPNVVRLSQSNANLAGDNHSSLRNSN